MLDAFLATDRPAAGVSDLLASLERASSVIVRLDQVLDSHPLLPAFLYRARLEAVRRQGGTRPPIRAALVRFWVERRFLRAPVPLTGLRALSAEAPLAPAAWLAAFLVADEAADHLELLRSLERGWASARAKVPAQRSTSRAALAVDVLAAAPLISATTLAGAIGMSVKCASELLERFVTAEVAAEVTHRSARRLFRLTGMAPVRAVTTAPRRPVPGRVRGRPRRQADEIAEALALPTPLPPISRFERPAIDYAALEAAMAHVDETIRRTRRRLQATTTAHGIVDLDEGWLAGPSSRA